MQNAAQINAEKSLAHSLPSSVASSSPGAALSSLISSPFHFAASSVSPLISPITSSSSVLLLLTFAFILLISAFGFLFFKWHMRNQKDENGRRGENAWKDNTPIISCPLKTPI